MRGQLRLELPGINPVGLARKENNIGIYKPRDGAPGTTEQSPRWEGPEESRPRGYLPAKDEPDEDRDAAGKKTAIRNATALLRP